MAGVSTATGFAANVSSNVLGGLCTKVVQVVKNIISLPEAVTEMEDHAQRLDNVIRGINQKLAQEQKAPQIIVKAWLDKAGQAIESSRSIDNEYQQQRNCLSCCPNCPNCFSRYTISKHIGDWKVKVAQLHSEKEADFPPNGEYGEPTPPTQKPIQTPKLFGTGIEAAQSELERWLIEDMSIRVVGVCGMGGVGKTSLLQTINNRAKVRQTFNPIIWVTVSKDHKISNLQNCIAGRLNLTLPNECNIEARKSALYSYLKDKRILLILDDLWESLELQNLGVSLNDTASKIVLSTRSTAVCAQMGVDKIISVKPLSGQEAWQLFCSRAFRNGNVPQEIEDVARKIAGECKGLPLAINVIAAAMGNHSYQHEWEHALHQMQNLDETFYDMHDEIEKNLFQRLKWSYNVLPECLKICFTYFAAYPEDRDIWVEDVIDIWAAEGLVKGSRESYLPDTAHSFINYLKDRYLIEDLRRISAVKMHDVIRDLAIRIAEEQGCYFKAGLGMSNFPLEEIIGKGCAKLSLMSNNLQSLPTTFACSSLSVLLLRDNPGIKEVPGSFLNNLPSLKILDLSGTGITSLPPCIGGLKHLACLQLQHTEIRELPEAIGYLKELQFLNVSFCHELRCLRESISELKRLKALDLTDCFELRYLPHGMSELVSLERLRMEQCIPLDLDEAAGPGRKYACLKDLQCLSSLRVFHVRIKSPVKEGIMGNLSNVRDLLVKFEGANSQDHLPQDMQAMKDLESLSLWYGHVERLPSWLSQFRKLAYLYLVRCTQLRELPAELQCLRVLWIAYCDDLEELQLGKGFPKLEELSLDSLNRLQCVELGAASPSGGLGEGASPSPPMLKSLTVWDCPKLNRLRGGWHKLNHLAEIKGERKWSDAIQWDEPNMKTLFQNKFK